MFSRSFKRTLRHNNPLHHLVVVLNAPVEKVAPHSFESQKAKRAATVSGIPYLIGFGSKGVRHI